MSKLPPRFVPASELLPPSPAGASVPAGTAVPARTAVPAGVAPALAARLARDPARPMVTFYDDATGERVELSTATLDNWVAKTANLLVDTVGLAPGDRVGVDLPVHWMSTVVLLAAWSAGMEVLLAVDGGQLVEGPPSSGHPGDAHPNDIHPGDAHPNDVHSGDAHPIDVLFVAASRLEAALDLDVNEIVALSLRPLGGRLPNPVAGVLDYAAEVPAHGDRFAAPPPPADQAGMLRLAAAVGTRWGLTAEDRVLTTADPASATGLVTSLLAPLVTGASVVLCRNLDQQDAAALTRRIQMERVTALDEQTAAGIALPARRLGLTDLTARSGAAPTAPATQATPTTQTTPAAPDGPAASPAGDGGDQA